MHAPYSFLWAFVFETTQFESLGYRRGLVRTDIPILGLGSAKLATEGEKERGLPSSFSRMMKTPLLTSKPSPPFLSLFLCIGGSEHYMSYSRELSHPMVVHGAITLLVLARADHVKKGCFMIEQRGGNDTVAAGVSSSPDNGRCCFSSCLGLRRRGHLASAFLFCERCTILRVFGLLPKRPFARTELTILGGLGSAKGYSITLYFLVGRIYHNWLRRGGHPSGY